MLILLKLLKTLNIDTNGEAIEFVIPFADRILVKLTRCNLRIYRMRDGTFTHTNSPTGEGTHFIIPLNYNRFVSRSASQTSVWSSNGELLNVYADDKPREKYFSALSTKTCVSYVLVRSGIVLTDLFTGEQLYELRLPANHKVIGFDGNILENEFASVTRTALHIWGEKQ